MSQITNFFAGLYPLSGLLVIFFTAVWYYQKEKSEPSKFVNFAIGISLVAYLFSFFSNYDAGLSLLFFLVRDFIIYAILIIIFKKSLANNTAVKLFFIVGIVAIIFSLFTDKKAKAPKVADMEAEILFEIKDKDDIEKVEELLEKYNPKIYQAFPQVKDKEITELDNWYVLDIEDENKNKIPNILKDLRKTKLVVGVEINEIYNLSPVENKEVKISGKKSGNKYEIEDAFIDKLWAFEFMDINNLFKFLRKNKVKEKAKIFILDTGIDSEHEDIEDNYLSLNSKYDSDKQGHGTHCAGIACSVSNNKKGIASFNLTNKFTSVTSIKVLNDNGSGTQEGIIDGIIIAADNGADVISMSLGGLRTDRRERAYNQAIKYANKKGAIIVVAAGNENGNAKNHIPASCEGVITVSAVDKKLERASFSNYVNDLKMKVSAPGVNIYSTFPNDKYKALNGTSMATPYVAGIIGIMKALNHKLTTKDVYEILNSTGINTKDTYKTGKFIQVLPAIKSVKKIKSD